ncbi:MAG: DUF4397 domain-containing protein [Chitinophagia bacterium]|nr:DUF4397 domain-containing protein [Chitinophagia bacterium]
MVLTKIIQPKKKIMKSSIIIRSILAGIVSSAMLLSCQKEAYNPVAQENRDLAKSAFVKFHNGIVNSNRTYIYADLVPLNGATIAFGSVFPSLSPSYAALNAGARAIAIRDTLFPSTQYPLAFNAQLEAGAYYTIFAYDSINAPNQKIVKDNIEAFGDTTARIRFANFPYSTTAMPNVDIFSQKRQANVFTNIAPTAVTDFIPYASNLNDTLYVRPTGTTTVLTQSTLLPTARRSYTVIFRGSYRVTTGAAARTLTSFLSY